MEKRIYSCATAHLDTVWNWTFEHTIADCLYNTLYENFDLFEKYPDYKFNFEGSYRYELFEEYYPEEFKKLKEYVKQGRWNVTGSAYENGDVNVPSPEALFRNILYGNGYFDKTFGKRSKEIYLPDCFGFGYALPSIIKHANLLGFTTQKLTWGSAYGTPFDIGRWFGVDGNYCFACVKPDKYDLTYKAIRSKKDNVQKIKENEEKYGLPWTFSFHGVGDQGGAPKEPSVSVLQKEIDENKENDIKVISARSDEIYDDLNALNDSQKQKLPKWDNELLMRDHGAGGYTSRAIGKRWNRRGEELCDMTERQAVIASESCGVAYPQNIMEKSWKRIIAHQFHDDLPGTSLQKVYQRSWNDYVLSLNQLEHEYTHSAGAVSNNMDTSWTEGVPVVVSNSIEKERTDIVKLRIKASSNKHFKAFDCEGNVYPVQILKKYDDFIEIAFICTVPSLGYKVIDIRESQVSLNHYTTVFASQNRLENERYKLSLNANGEISSIFDKKCNKELLKAPIRHQLIDYYGSIPWPAWELTYKSINSKKISYPVLESMHVLYQGAVTAAIEVIQTYGNSKFKSVVSLDCGSNMVKVQNEIEWWEQKTLLKDCFNLSVSNEYATYDLGLGAIKRKNNTDKLFEVPAQKWVDITKNNFGISVISDSKYGWDKPADNIIRMTVLHSPARNFLAGSMQSQMELGLNRYGYALTSHENKIEDTQLRSRFFHQPLTALIVDRHDGLLNDSFSFAELSEDNVILRAMKKAENSDEIIVRFNEGSNKRTENIRFKIGAGIVSAKEIYASEEIKDEAKVENGCLVFDLNPYEVKSFALRLSPMKHEFKMVDQTSIPLEYNKTVFTDKNKDSMPVIKQYKSLSIPKSLRPNAIVYKGIEFALDSDKGMLCANQKIKLNKKYTSLYFLAYSLNGDKNTTINLDNKPKELTINDAYERIGKWDLFGVKDAANIKECNLAYEFTHMHNENGADVIAKQMYVFAYKIDVKNVDTLELPNDIDIVILSAAALKTDIRAELGYPLYDRVTGRSFKNNLSLKGKCVNALSHLPHNAVPTFPLFKRKDNYKVK